MSTDSPSGQTDSSDTKTPAKETPAAKPRSRIEKIVVRTLIVALVIFAAIEVRAIRGYTKTLNDVQAALDAADKEQTDLTLEDLSSSMSLFPSQVKSNDEKHLITLKWWSFLRPSGYQIILHTKSDEDNPVVAFLSTPVKDAEEPRNPQPGPNSGEEGDDEDGDGDGDGDANAGAGGRGGFSSNAIFEANDKNNDGKLSKDEWPERGAQLLERADEDKDGEVTKDELDKALANRPKRSGGAKRNGGRGRSGGPGKRKSRPAVDDQGNKTTEKTPEKKTESKTEKKTEKKTDA